MEADEEDLRMLITSRNGNLYAQAIMNAVRRGEVVVINRADGTTLTLTEPHLAKQTLCDVFGWKCP